MLSAKVVVVLVCMLLENKHRKQALHTHSIEIGPTQPVSVYSYMLMFL